ncbi:hypothetical protein [Natronobiforma cellulositropha]|nr:hypothetical protein [Natronobiforma cellulositropha]
MSTHESAQHRPDCTERTDARMGTTERALAGVSPASERREHGGG